MEWNAINVSLGFHMVEEIYRWNKTGLGLIHLKLVDGFMGTQPNIFDYTVDPPLIRGFASAVSVTPQSTKAQKYSMENFRNKQ